jgi:hypothetical protein
LKSDGFGSEQHFFKAGFLERIVLNRFCTPLLQIGSAGAIVVLKKRGISNG